MASVFNEATPRRAGCDKCRVLRSTRDGEACVGTVQSEQDESFGAASSIKEASQRRVLELIELKLKRQARGESSNKTM